MCITECTLPVQMCRESRVSMKCFYECACGVLSVMIVTKKGDNRFVSATGKICVFCLVSFIKVNHLFPFFMT